MKKMDLVGQRFGRLLVIAKSEPLHGHVRWLCKCDCGNERIVYGSALKSGNTTSCGCYKTENAKRLYSGVRQNDKRLYAVWNGIKQRCRNKNNRSYSNYGGRGIKIDEEWARNYESFYNWAMRAGYHEGMEIDRIDNDGDYCEDNCRFVNREVQSNNKRNVKLYEIDGVSKSLAQWCRDYNQEYYLVRQRVYKLGWSIKEALTAPKNNDYSKTERRKHHGLHQRLARTL